RGSGTGPAEISGVVTVGTGQIPPAYGDGGKEGVNLHIGPVIGCMAGGREVQVLTVITVRGTQVSPDGNRVVSETVRITAFDSIRRTDVHTGADRQCTWRGRKATAGPDV